MELISICPYPNSVSVGKTFRQTFQMIGWAKRLNKVFALTGWAKAELHRRSGVPLSSVYKYLAGGVKQPRGDILDKLADALGVERLWLKENVPPMRKNKPVTEEEVLTLGPPAMRPEGFVPDLSTVNDLLKALSEIDGMCIRAIREFIVSQNGAPQQLRDLDAQAQSVRHRLQRRMSENK